MADVEDEGDFDTILRRNTYSRFSKPDSESGDVESSNFVFCTPVARPSSAENRVTSTSSTKLNPNAYSTLNSFNDMGHLSRRVFNEKGENHLKSLDFDNSFGFRKVLDSNAHVTAITATTISTCLGSILLDLIVQGEKIADEGHYNSAEFDIFCGYVMMIM